MIDLDDKKNAFSVSYVDGALRAECTPDATPQTLFLLKQSFITMIQTVGRALRPDQDCQSLASLPLPAPPPQSDRPDAAPAAHELGAVAQAVTRAYTATPPAAQPSRIVWLSDAIKEWRVNGGVRFSEQTWIDSYAPTFRILLELMGDVRRIDPDADPSMVGKLDILVHKLTREHISNFYENLKLFPARQGKRCDEVEALERIREAQRTKQPPGSASNVAKKLQHVAPSMVWFELKGYITPEVLKEFKLAQQAAEGRVAKAAKRGKKKGYVAFASEELKAIFEQSSFLVVAVRADWAYWVPLLCLFNGLRVAEGSQLHTGDFCVVDGVPCLRTLTIDDDEDGNPVNPPATKAEYLRRLKNEASRRTVPVHPRLIELGILDFVAQVAAGSSESKHLFPTLNWHPKSLWGRRPSEVMGDLIRSAGAYGFRKKVPHSLRSNFNQAVDNTGLEAALIQRLLGHSTGSMKDERYGEAEFGVAFPAAHVLPYLQRADFDINVPSWKQILERRAASGAKPGARHGDGDKSATPTAWTDADTNCPSGDGKGASA